MGTVGQKSAGRGEETDFYILFLMGVYNLIFVDVPLAGMPLRTLLLLLADFLCLAVRAGRGRLGLPRWKDCRAHEKGMALLTAAAAVWLAASALSDSGAFWVCADALALLMMYPCLHGAGRFPEAAFPAHGVCSGITCVFLLFYYLADGACEPLVALLLRDGAAAAWLVACITVNAMAYCFRERGQAWYGIIILTGSFLLFLQKNMPGIAAAASAFLLLPILCRPSARLVRRAAQMGFAYVSLLGSMPLITGYTPLFPDTVTYSLEAGVYIEMLMAAAGVWFFHYWDRHAEGAAGDTALPEMRTWFRNAATACLTGIMGAAAAAGFIHTDDTKVPQGVVGIIVNSMGDSGAGPPGLFARMYGLSGDFGIMAACILLYAVAVRLYRTRRWRTRMHKLYRLAAVVLVLQGMFLAQSMASLPTCAAFFFLFMDTEEEPAGKTMEKTTEDWGRTDETDYTDTMLQ